MLGFRAALVAGASAAVLMTSVGMAAPAHAAAFVPNGIYKLHSVEYFTLVMDVASSGNHVVGSKDAPPSTPPSQRQDWDVENVGSGGNVITIRNQGANGYLALDGTQAVVGPKPVQWTVVKVDKGYNLQTADASMVLAMMGSTPGAPVEAQGHNGQYNQQWTFGRVR